MPGANDPISSLPTATALTGAELVPLVQSGVTSKSTTNDIIALAGVTPSTPTIPSDWKDEVDVATTANIVLSGEQTIDGVLTSTSRVLVKNQTLGATNGIYVTAAGAWSRSTDADTSAEVTSGMTTLVLSGTLNANIIYSLVTPDPITLGTTSLTFQGVASSFPAFTGKTVAGTTYSTVLLDSGKRLNCTNAATKTITISRQAVVQHAVNTEIEIFNAGAGLLTIAPDTGVTINSWNSTLTVPQYMGVKVKKRANPNTWDITGAIDSDLQTIAGLTATTDNFIQSSSSAWASRTPLQAAATLQGTGLDADMVGFRGVPQNAQTVNYTTVAADAGKHLYHASGAGAGDTYTIDSNANVAYEIGTAITFVNMAADTVAIAITSDTMYLAGTGTTGSRTLAQYGIATALKTGTTEWVISGTGLT